MDTATVLHQLADRLDQQPNRPADRRTIRGYARALGLTDDMVDLIPDPDGAHHSAYATRLRALAGGH